MFFFGGGELNLYSCHKICKAEWVGLSFLAKTKLECLGEEKGELNAFPAMTDCCGGSFGFFFFFCKFPILSHPRKTCDQE